MKTYIAYYVEYGGNFIASCVAINAEDDGDAETQLRDLLDRRRAAHVERHGYYAHLSYPQFDIRYWDIQIVEPRRGITEVY